MEIPNRFVPMEVGERLVGVRSRIEGAGGDPARICIVAVTKSLGAEAVNAAIAAGLGDVGENYAQELRDKHAQVAEMNAQASAGQASAGPSTQAITQASAQANARWHFIGQLQRNKVRMLAPLVSVWQSLDTAALIDEVAKRAPGAQVYVQVNLSEQPGRGGCEWADAPGLVERAQVGGLEVLGLMGVAPDVGAPESRPYFRRLKQQADRLDLPEVSMGMSGDFEIAVQEGATMVRIGSLLFGPRLRHTTPQG